MIVYKNSEYRKHQIYTYSEWPGGLYGSPSMAGTRPGNVETFKVKFVDYIYILKNVFSGRFCTNVEIMNEFQRNFCPPGIDDYICKKIA